MKDSVAHILLCLVGIFALPVAASGQKLMVGYSAVSAISAPFWIIEDGGYFKEEGLDGDLIYISASSTMAQAMLAGEVAISTPTSQVMVDTGLQGSDLVATGAIVNFVALYIMAAPEIKSIADLKGKPVGVSRLPLDSMFNEILSCNLFLFDTPYDSYL